MKFKNSTKKKPAKVLKTSSAPEVMAPRDIPKLENPAPDVPKIVNQTPTVVPKKTAKPPTIS